MTNHNGDFEKAVSATEKAFDELDKALRDLSLLIEKRRKQCHKSGKKKSSR